MRHRKLWEVSNVSTILIVLMVSQVVPYVQTHHLYILKSCSFLHISYIWEEWFEYTKKPCMTYGRQPVRYFYTSFMGLPYEWALSLHQAAETIHMASYRSCSSRALLTRRAFSTSNYLVSFSSSVFIIFRMKYLSWVYPLTKPWLRKAAIFSFLEARSQSCHNVNKWDKHIPLTGTESKDFSFCKGCGSDDIFRGSSSKFW